MNGVFIIKNDDVDYIINEIFDEKDLLKVMPADYYLQLPPEHIMLVGHKKGIYSFPTIELCEWIKNNNDLSNCIEIGSGNGSLARYLGIKATDSKMQLITSINGLYNKFKQPTIDYPDDVEELNAVDAITKYKPKIVISCWTTHIYQSKESWREGSVYGINEEWLIDNVKKYIFIGNKIIHRKKKILEFTHKTYQFEWIISRSHYYDDNIIYVWEK